MHTLSAQQLILIFKIIAYLVGIIGAIVAVSGGILAYFYKADRFQNGEEHAKLFDKTDENTENIEYIKGRLKL